MKDFTALVMCFTCLCGKLAKNTMTVNVSVKCPLCASGSLYLTTHCHDYTMNTFVSECLHSSHFIFAKCSKKQKKKYPVLPQPPQQLPNSVPTEQVLQSVLKLATDCGTKSAGFKG